MEKGGPHVAMKYYNDQAFLAKIRERLGPEMTRVTAACERQADPLGQSKELQEMLDKLKSDPELKATFEKLEKGTEEEVAKILKDEQFLGKLREKTKDSPILSHLPHVPRASALNMPPACQTVAANVVQSKEMQEKIKMLKHDPELKSAFLEMEKGSPANIMKYYNDQEFLAKVRLRLGDVPEMK